MATYPPPPPGGPYPPPFTPDVRDQRRFLRDQARAQAYAQKAAYRAQRNAGQAQRDAYRAQTRSLRRSSILGPLLLVSVGVIALLLSTGRLPMLAFTSWYARFWPLLIVAAGLILLGEWAVDQYVFTRNEAIPYARRGLGGGAIVLLILLIFFGLTTRTVHANSDFLNNAFSINGDNINEIFGEKYDREQQIDQPFAPGTALFLDNPHGDITITGTSTDNQIHITVNKQIYASSNSSADSKSTTLSPVLTLTGSTLHVSLPATEGSSADLSITLPATAPTTLSAAHGDIHVTSMRAPVNLSGDHGDIDASQIDASVTARLNNRNSSFSAHNISGDVALRGRADNAAITDVHGQTSMEGEFFGDVHFERLLGPVSFQTDRTHFTIAHLPGEIDMSNDSDLSGSDLTGPTELHTRSRNISFQRIAGPVDIANTNGTVDLVNALPLGAVIVNNKNGAINITVPLADPVKSGVSIQAQTHDGTIENDLSLQPMVSGEQSQLHGAVGDGATHLDLATTHGDITIHKQFLPTPPPH